MRTFVDPQLAEEAAVYGLVWACDDCANYVPDEGNNIAHCALLWPLGDRRETLMVGNSLVFCKEFEPG